MPRSADFATFCAATHAWLAAAPTLDPALAAAADLLRLGLSERALDAWTSETSDAHTLLGASVLQSLWAAVLIE